MHKLSERGVIHLLVPLILLLGIVGAVLLVTRGEPLKLLPRATVSSPITPQTSFTLAAQKTTYNVGELIEVKLLVRSDIDAANLFAAKINYDPQLLQLGRVDVTSFVTNWVEQYWGDPGKISLVGGVPAPGFQTEVNSAPAKMASLYLTALKAGNTTISFDDTSAIYRNSDNLNILGPKNGVTIPIGTVGSPAPTTVPAPATITVSPDIVERNGTLNVTWSGISEPHLGDYINIITADGQRGVTSRTYRINNNCAWSTPTSGTPKSSGSCTIKLDNDPINEDYPGPYHLVLASGTTPGVTTILAKSNNFNLTPLSVSVEKKTPYDELIVRWNFPDKPYLRDGLFLKNADGTNATNSGPYYIHNNCGFTTPSNVTPKNVGRCTISIDGAFAGGKAGSYKFDLYSGSTQFPSIVMATSNIFTIGSTTSSPVATPIPGSGDGNNDGKVNLVDLSILLSDFNKASGFRKGIDLNGDGKINTFDFSLMRNLFIQKGVIKG